KRPAQGKEGVRRRTRGVRRVRSDAGSWWAQKYSRRMSCGSDGTSGAKLTHRAVSRPELDNYDKKRRLVQCGKGTGWRVGYGRQSRKGSECKGDVTRTIGSPCFPRTTR